MIYREYVCANCGAKFERYPMNATRAARPQYCSSACFGLMLEKRAGEAFLERFFSRIKFGADDECWEWQGRRDYRSGYGRIDFRRPGEDRARPRVVHRVAFQLMRGEIPDGLDVCHTCDNPPCCNPHHHFLGTQTDNNADRHAKGRTRAGLVQGSKVGTSKLTEPEVLAIVAAKRTNEDLAEHYRVSKDAIVAIRKGVNWSWLTGVGR